MKWDNGECKISDDLLAEVWQPFNDGLWAADIHSGDHRVWTRESLPTEADAKAAVCHWIGKTMAQFSNALAAGCNEQDDGA